jgi:hypothetical protein
VGGSLRDEIAFWPLWPKFVLIRLAEAEFWLARLQSLGRFPFGTFDLAALVTGGEVDYVEHFAVVEPAFE